jgi:ankyrin repeat protein
MLACKLGLINVAEYLLNSGSVVNETNILGDTPLKMAQRYGHEDLVLILIQKYKALSKSINKR